MTIDDTRLESPISAAMQIIRSHSSYQLRTVAAMTVYKHLGPNSLLASTACELRASGTPGDAAAVAHWFLSVVCAIKAEITYSNASLHEFL